MCALAFRTTTIVAALTLLLSGNSFALDSLVIRLPGGIPLVMIMVPAGVFTMGSADPDTSNWHVGKKIPPRETPAHKVNISSPFYIGKFEVTQRQWKAVMDSNPSFFNSCPDCPVEKISWYDCKNFCTKLNDLNLGKFRLPSEAEWEYACRAGTKGRFFFGDCSCNPDDLGCAILDRYAVWSGNAKGETEAAGGKLPNPWGLFDLLGNVYEWCEDDWHPNYQGAPADGKPWLSNVKNTEKCLRGSWRGYNKVKYFTSFFRASHEPQLRHDCCGFRLVREK